MFSMSSKLFVLMTVFTFSHVSASSLSITSSESDLTFDQFLSRVPPKLIAFVVKNAKSKSLDAQQVENDTALKKVEKSLKAETEASEGTKKQKKAMCRLAKKAEGLAKNMAAIVKARANVQLLDAALGGLAEKQFSSEAQLELEKNKLLVSRVVLQLFSEKEHLLVGQPELYKCALFLEELRAPMYKTVSLWKMNAVGRTVYKEGLAALDEMDFRFSKVWSTLTYVHRNPNLRGSGDYSVDRIYDNFYALDRIYNSLFTPFVEAMVAANVSANIISPLSYKPRKKAKKIVDKMDEKGEGKSTKPNRKKKSERKSKTPDGDLSEVSKSYASSTAPKKQKENVVDDSAAAKAAKEKEVVALVLTPEEIALIQRVHDSDDESSDEEADGGMGDI